MNFFRYLGVSREEFEVYLQDGYVTESLHKDFPLNLFTYSRKCVHDNKWDKVTSKCRGIVVHRWTEEIVARPFEKFHNFGSPLAGEVPELESLDALHLNPPTIIEKVDGFLITGYRWEGKWYAASKGSFHSIHAKWATVELNKNQIDWPEGYTPVFEGLHRDLRVVVDYGKREGLILLALVNNDTGEEETPEHLAKEAALRGFGVPTVYDMSLADAVDSTRKDNVLPGEGYVLTWYRKDAPPFRLKLKYLEYLRLHRIITGVSPKAIWEMLSQSWLAGELRDYLNHTTPWFEKFTRKWVTVLQAEHDRILAESTKRYKTTKEIVKGKYDRCELEFDELRKAYAAEFLKPENKEFAPVMFAMLDGKDVSVVIWKRVKEMTKNGHPLVDSYTT